MSNQPAPSGAPKDPAPRSQPDKKHRLRMMPIHELLSRIRWDPVFGSAPFVIGYFDRISRRIVRVPLTRISFPSGERFSFEVLDEEGKAHSVPYHRVRTVYRDGVLIWRRPAIALGARERA